MSPDKLNPKAQEERGKMFISLGASLYKGALVLLTLAPAGLILKTIIEGKSAGAALSNLMTGEGIYILLFFSLLAFIGGLRLSSAGLVIIHNSEIKKTLE